MAGTVRAHLVAALVTTVAAQSCIEGNGTTTFEMYMPYHDVTVTVPPVCCPLSNYSYAADNALVAVPAKCYTDYYPQLVYAPNWADRQPGGKTNMFYFRISNPDAEYAMLADMKSCASGLVVSDYGHAHDKYPRARYLRGLTAPCL